MIEWERATDYFDAYLEKTRRRGASKAEAKKIQVKLFDQGIDATYVVYPICFTIWGLACIFALYQLACIFFTALDSASDASTATAAAGGGGADSGEVRIGRGGRVHLEAVEDAARGAAFGAAEVAGERGDPVPDRALPQVSEVVGRVGRDDEHPPAGAGLGQGGGGGDRGLADTALAADEQDPTGGGEL